MIFRDNKILTLREVFESLGLDAYHLSVDTLDMHVSITHTHIYIFFVYTYMGAYFNANTIIGT